MARELPTEKQMLLALAFVCAFFLGLLMTWTMVQGMKRGQVRIRRHWWNKREDELMFWLATGMYAIVGIGLMIITVVLAIQWFGL